MAVHLFYNIVHKPTFSNQLLALPRAALPQTLEKVEMLRVSPAPDGKSKKRLHGYKGAVFRLRSGDYRILYQFDANEGWVSLIGVDNRKDVYRNGLLVADDREISLANLPDAPEAEVREPRGAPALPPESSVPSEPLDLPTPVTLEMLERLRIGVEHHAVLVRCRTLDDLIAAGIPESVRTLVFDTLVPNYDRALEQPNLRVSSTADFQRFVDGELTHFLLQLDPEQQRFVDWAVSGAGPTLIKGGPGTGKTIIALYRVQSLIAALRRSGNHQPRILFTSYTNTLVEASRQLLRQLLGPDHNLVTIVTADKLCRDIAAAAGALPSHTVDDGAAMATVARAKTLLTEGAREDRELVETIADLNLLYLFDEIDKVIVAREHPDVASYLAENRTGRGVRITARQRRAIWRLHEERELITARQREMSFSQLRRVAVNLVREGRGPTPFDGVLIDEAQDLDPTVLRLLAALCKSKDRLFLTADPNQSIYGSGFRWIDVHQDLRFRGRTGVLKKSYRTTQQIMRAAEAFLTGAELEIPDEAVDVAREGQLPTAAAVTEFGEEADAVARFVRDTTRELRVGFSACAVLVPSERIGLPLAAALTSRGIPARFMAKKEIRLDRPELKVIPMKSAKGLEFPIVAIAGLSGRYMPPIPLGSPEDQVRESEATGRRTLYVAMTRAMDRLLVLVPQNHPVLDLAKFDPTWWTIVSDTQVMPVSSWSAREQGDAS